MRERPGFFGPITDMFKGGVNNSFKGFYDKAGSKGETHPVDFIFSLMLLGAFVIKHDKNENSKLPECRNENPFPTWHADFKLGRPKKCLQRQWRPNHFSVQSG